MPDFLVFYLFINVGFLKASCIAQLIMQVVHSDFEGFSNVVLFSNTKAKATH